MIYINELIKVTLYLAPQAWGVYWIYFSRKMTVKTLHCIWEGIHQFNFCMEFWFTAIALMFKYQSLSCFDWISNMWVQYSNPICSVKWFYNVIQFNTILHYITAITVAESASDFRITADTPLLILTSELWGVYSEDLGENWPCYNCITL